MANDLRHAAQGAQALTIFEFDGLIGTMTPWGGAREGAGRKSVYAGKDRMTTYPMALTKEARSRLGAIRTRTGLGQNDLIEHLLRAHGPTLTITENGYSPQVFPPIAIRLTDLAAEILMRARVRTGESWTTIGEVLVRRFGHRTAFPPIPRRRVARRSSGRRSSR